MNTRKIRLECIRPKIPTARVHEGMHQDERFQNTVLRPIIKFQNDLLIEAFKNYITKHKKVFYELSLVKRTDYIENAVQKDMKFRNSLKGMIIGLFTVEDYMLYIKNSSALNKRMMNLVKQRLIDNLQLFETPELLNVV